MPRASYEGAAMPPAALYVCRSLRRAALLPQIRARPSGICFCCFGARPARGRFASLRFIRHHQDACFRLLATFPIQPFTLDAGLLAVRGDADVQLDRSHALAPLWSIARLLNTGSAAGASCAA